MTKKRIQKVEYFSEQIQNIYIEGFSVRTKPSLKGFSVVKYPNKLFYIGEMIDGYKNGEGYFYMGDNIIFKGIYKLDQKFSGFLMQTNTKKKIYEG